jgi:hypothetical protein
VAEWETVIVLAPVKRTSNTLTLSLEMQRLLRLELVGYDKDREQDPKAR